MKFKNIYVYLLLLIIGLASCSDNDLYSNGNVSEQDCDLLIDLSIDNFGVRTRDVDFTDGATVRLNSIWLGFFDSNDGKCVVKKELMLDYAVLISGEETRGAIRVNFDDEEKSKFNTADSYYMVAVVNYLGDNPVYAASVIQDAEGNDALEKKPLKEVLGKVTDWGEFNSIGVDTESAYNIPHNTDSPVMAGFLNNKTNRSATHIKIDQFRQESDNHVALSPFSLEDELKVKFDGEKFVTTNKTLFLRRLVANINVNINVTNPNLELTEVTYKKFNTPKVVYIIERKTTDGTEATNTSGSFPDKNENIKSPNIADLNPKVSYTSDENWQSSNLSGFSFQQFANKHYARNNVTTNEEREVRVKSGDDFYFKALADSPEDFNNYASYFVIKMRFLDREKERVVEAEYPIHIGNTSDEWGNAVPFQNGKAVGNPKDFVCARNISYNYNVYVNGVNNIYYNVETENHSAAQYGTYWDLSYMNENYNNQNGLGMPAYNLESDEFINAVSSEGGYFENAIYIKNNELDMAFRLYGYSEETKNIQGYNYNFEQISFSRLHGLWPEAANYSHYYQDFKALQNDIQQDGTTSKIPDDLLTGLTIINPETNYEMNVKDFIKYLHSTLGDSEPEGKYFHVRVAKSNLKAVPESEKHNYARALYICDRNGKLDSDGCTKLVTVYAIAQYPPSYPDFQATPVFKTEQYSRWKNSWPDRENFKVTYAYTYNNSQDDNWRGNINSIVNLAYDVENDLGASKYEVSIKAGNATLSTQTFNKSEVTKDGKYIVLPLRTNWANVATGTYDVDITLVDPSSLYSQGNKIITVKGKLVLSDVKEWKFGETFWQSNYTYSTMFGSVFGINQSPGINRQSDPTKDKKYYSIEKNFFMEYNGLELGVFELSSTAAFIQATDNGRLYTIADYYPNNTDTFYPNSNPDFRNQPTQGNSFQLRFSTTKNGNLYIEMVNSNTTANNPKKFTIILGDNLQVSTSGLPSGTKVNGNTYEFTNYPTTKTTLKFPVSVKDANKNIGNEITIGIVKDVGYFYSIKYE